MIHVPAVSHTSFAEGCECLDCRVFRAHCEKNEQFLAALKAGHPVPIVMGPLMVVKFGPMEATEDGKVVE